MKTLLSTMTAVLAAAPALAHHQDLGSASHASSGTNMMIGIVLIALVAGILAFRHLRGAGHQVGRSNHSG
ncbi:hypothetical protein [Parasulfitobacter algicola]|uniref:Uncharacterized protein n=1 Tax=Parasulfitobacter algicola TaxID=2614809 RepID=A0ABX2IVA2_9RHOB|nr:hypothetical protein [Sulfitobacter algicola]NSX54201.1 hypothetical protein [Sulfitobacter algicola]